VIEDCKLEAAPETGIKSFELKKCGQFRLSRAEDGMVVSLAIGNCGSFPAIRVYDSFRNLYFCPQTFMTGSFVINAGFKGFLIVEAYAGRDGVPPQLSVHFRDGEK
jgi:hypothetical protein